MPSACRRASACLAASSEPGQPSSATTVRSKTEQRALDAVDKPCLLYRWEIRFARRGVGDVGKGPEIRAGFPHERFGSRWAAKSPAHDLAGGALRAKMAVMTAPGDPSERTMIRVVLVDDHAIVRSGLRLVLANEADIEVVGEAENGERAVFEALANRPDVVVMDVQMPGISGIEAIPSVLQAVPATRVLVLSMQDEPRYVRQAFEAGASGYALKDAADTDVVEAVRAVARGEQYVHPTLGAKLVSADVAERRRAELDPLSEREREVLRLLALGHTNQELASMLFISVRTAETHRAHIMQKLGLQSRADLVRYALDNELIAD